MNDRIGVHAIGYSTKLIAILAVGGALHLARAVLVPIALAIVLAALLVPVVRWLERLRLPTPAAATIAILATIGALAAVTTALEPPVEAFIDEVPKSIAAARPKIDALGESIRQLTGTASPRRGARPAGEASPRAPTAPALSGAVAGTPAVAQALGVATSVLGEAIEVVLLALFMLAAGNAWKDKVAKTFASAERQQAVVDTVAAMRDGVARYLLVTALINIGQGIVIGLALWMLGYPDALLWGVLTFLLEFIPYLGGLAMIGLLLAVGLATERSFVVAVAGPAIYLAVTTLQNNLVSPIAYSRGMRLNPTAILVGLMVWWWLWGVAGAFLAVPILAAIEVVARRTPSLHGVAAFLSD